MLWLSAQSLTQETFREKFLTNLQKLRQNKVICSVGNSFAYFSYKKSRSVRSSLHTFLRKKGVFTTFFCIKTHLQVKLIIVTFLLTGKSEYIFAPQKALFSSNLRKISKLKRNKKFHKNTSKRILHKNRRRVFSLLPFYL